MASLYVGGGGSVVDSLYEGGCSVLLVPNVGTGDTCAGDVCNDIGVVCSGDGGTGTSSRSIR